MGALPDSLKTVTLAQASNAFTLEHVDLGDFLEHYEFDHDEFKAIFGDESLEDFLDHAGVKGMRWGVRKRDKGPSSVTVTNSATGKSAQIKINPKKTTVDIASGTVSTSSKKELKSIHSQIEKNKLKLMSDDELKGRINRLKMEQEFKKLNVSQQSPGKKIVKKILSDTGNQVVNKVIAEAVVPKLTDIIITQGTKALARR